MPETPLIKRLEAYAMGLGKHMQRESVAAPVQKRMFPLGVEPFFQFVQRHAGKEEVLDESADYVDCIAHGIFAVAVAETVFYNHSVHLLCGFEGTLYHVGSRPVGARGGICAVVIDYFWDDSGRMSVYEAFVAEQVILADCVWPLFKTDGCFVDKTESENGRTCGSAEVQVLVIVPDGIGESAECHLAQFVRFGENHPFV